MIYDSNIWKKELEANTLKFKQLINETEFSTDWLYDVGEDGLTASYKFFIEFQKYCFYSSVITRKFLESKRLSDELIQTNYTLKCFNKLGNKVLTKENFESIETEYDLDNEFITDMNLVKICNLFIHSFIFNPKLIDYKHDLMLPDDDIENWEVEGISGLFINTDYTKDKLVYFLNLDFITKLFEAVYEDNIAFCFEDVLKGKTIRSRDSNKLIN